MSAMASQITSVWIVCSTVCSGADQRKHQSSVSLLFVRGIHRWPVDSPHKWPVTQENVSIWWRHHELTCGAACMGQMRLLVSSLPLLCSDSLHNVISYDRSVDCFGLRDRALPSAHHLEIWQAARLHCYTPRRMKKLYSGPVSVSDERLIARSRKCKIGVHTNRSEIS